MKRLFVYSLLFILIFLRSAGQLQAAPPVSEPLAAAKSIYKIWVVNKETDAILGSGTGWVAENKEGKLRIVTNSHVCVDNDLEINPSVGFLTKNTLEDGRPLKKFIFDPFADICVLGFVNEADEAGEIPLVMSAAPTKEGEPIIVIGHPLGGPLKAVIGYRISQVVLPDAIIDMDWALVAGESQSCLPLPIPGDKCLYFRRSDTYRVEIKPGNSGSPVLNRQGKVVGIIWGTYALEEDMSLAANWNQLSRYIK